MIFLDSNIPMYLVGAGHPNKARARVLLERLIGARERLVTSVEVFQELLHRYVAIDRRDAIEPCWRALAGIIDEVFPVDFSDAKAAMALVLDTAGLSGRDALHVSVMRRYGVSRILSFDAGFDLVPDLTRLN